MGSVCGSKAQDLLHVWRCVRSLQPSAPGDETNPLALTGWWSSGSSAELVEQLSQLSEVDRDGRPEQLVVDPVVVVGDDVAVARRG